MSRTFKEKRIFKSMLQSLYDKDGDDDDSKAMLIERMDNDSDKTS